MLMMNTHITKGSILLLLIFSLTTHRVWSQDTDPGKEKFVIVEEHPSYEGGLETFYNFVKNEIRYPRRAREEGVDGRVYSEFVVERDGSLSNIQIIKGIDDVCDIELLRVLGKAGPFKPASQRGRTVRTKFKLPVIFQLNPSLTNPDGTVQGTIIVGELESNMGKLKVTAQYKDGVWSGRVLSPEDEPLPGANIVVNGTTTGTVSDPDGFFRLEVAKSKKIQVSFMGYERIVLENH